MFTTSFFVLMYVILGWGFVVINVVANGIESDIKMASDTFDERPGLRALPKDIKKMSVAISLIIGYLILSLLWPYCFIRDIINHFKAAANRRHLKEVNKKGTDILMDLGYFVTGTTIDLDNRTIEFRFKDGQPINDDRPRFGNSLWALADLIVKYDIGTLTFIHDCGDYTENAYIGDQSLRLNDDIYEVGYDMGDDKCTSDDTKSE